MANNNQDTPNDRRDVLKTGTSLSRSTQRNNTATEAGIHPKSREEDEVETVDQDPGERQKENQNQQKDDPLAA